MFGLFSLSTLSGGFHNGKIPSLVTCPQYTSVHNNPHVSTNCTNHDLCHAWLRCDLSRWNDDKLRPNRNPMAIKMEMRPIRMLRFRMIRVKSMLSTLTALAEAIPKAVLPRLLSKNMFRGQGSPKRNNGENFYSFSTENSIIILQHLMFLDQRFQICFAQGALRNPRTSIHPYVPNSHVLNIIGSINQRLLFVRYGLDTTLRE